eukprot:TRINITY_DN17537_c0_g1_i1.p1 TRINITY_DN17537_c0_g1~~TRINITY_DN17537_c0_g1_i1.p1  ORF type:complete len:913 (-),score=191.61 TRINITY_DN17537_c0_g1_i1:140-2641(-)
MSSSLGSTRSGSSSKRRDFVKQKDREFLRFQQERNQAAKLEEARRKRRRRMKKSKKERERGRKGSVVGLPIYRDVGDFLELMTTMDDIKADEEAEALRISTETPQKAQELKAEQAYLKKSITKDESRLAKNRDEDEEVKKQLEKIFNIRKVTRENWIQKLQDRLDAKDFEDNLPDADAQIHDYEWPMKFSGDEPRRSEPKDWEWHSEGSNGHRLNQLISSVRSAVLKNFGDYKSGWLAMSVPAAIFHESSPHGVMGPKVTRGSFVCGMKKLLGFSEHEANIIFHYASCLPYINKSVAGDLDEKEFADLLTGAEPVETLAALRFRLFRKYREDFEVTFRRFDKDYDGCLKPSEFADMCFAVGGSLKAAKKHFMTMVEQHSKPAKYGTSPKVPLASFLLCLRQADGLDETQRIRRKVKTAWEQIGLDQVMKALPLEYFAAPITPKQLRMVGEDLALDDMKVRQLVHLGRRKGGLGIAWMQDILLRIMAGFGHHLRKLAWQLTGACALRHSSIEWYMAAKGAPDSVMVKQMAQTAPSMGFGVSKTNLNQRPDIAKARSETAAASGIRSQSEPKESVSSENLPGEDKEERKADEAVTVEAESEDEFQSMLSAALPAPREEEEEEAEAESEETSRIQTETSEKYDLENVLSEKQEPLGPKLPPIFATSDACAERKMLNSRGGTANSSRGSRRNGSRGRPRRTSLRPRPQTTPNLPGMQDGCLSSPGSANGTRRPATSWRSPTQHGSPWWASVGHMTPRFAATMAVSERLVLDGGEGEPDADRERDRQQRAQEWANVGVQIGALPSSSPILRRNSDIGSRDEVKLIQRQGSKQSPSEGA